MAQRQNKVEFFELFFDLVYVFTLIQITRDIAADGDVTGIAHGAVVLVLVWWVWVSFTSLANMGLPRGASRDWRPLIFAAGMGLLLLIALSIPRAFWDNSLLFAYSYLGLALLALGGQLWVTHSDPQQHRAVRRAATISMLLPLSLVVSAYVSDETASVVIIVIGLTAAILAPISSGYDAWRINPDHLAERYGLFVLITLGEFIISIGEGATKAAMSPLLIAMVLVSLLLVIILWRHYFIEVLLTGEARLQELHGRQLVRFARYGYSFLHLAMVLGIVLAAVALKSAMVDLTTPLDDLAESLLPLGVALFLTATTVYSALARGSVSRLTLAAVLILAALTAVGPRLPTAVLIVIVTVVAMLCLDPRTIGQRTADATKRPSADLDELGE